MKFYLLPAIVSAVLLFATGASAADDTPTPTPTATPAAAHLTIIEQGNGAICNYPFTQAQPLGNFTYSGSGAIGTFTLTNNSGCGYRGDQGRITFTLAPGRYSFAEVASFPLGYWQPGQITCNSSSQRGFFGGGFSGNGGFVNLGPGDSAFCTVTHAPAAGSPAAPATATATPSPVPPAATATPAPVATQAPVPQLPPVVNITNVLPAAATPASVAAPAQATPVAAQPLFRAPSTGDGGLLH